MKYVLPCQRAPERRASLDLGVFGGLERYIIPTDDGASEHPHGSPGRPEVSLLNEISEAPTRALISSPFCQEKKNDL